MPVFFPTLFFQKHQGRKPDGEKPLRPQGKRSLPVTEAHGRNAAARKVSVLQPARTHSGAVPVIKNGPDRAKSALFTPFCAFAAARPAA